MGGVRSQTDKQTDSRIIYNRCTGKSGRGVSKSTEPAKFSLARACWPWSFISPENDPRVRVFTVSLNFTKLNQKKIQDECKDYHTDTFLLIYLEAILLLKSTYYNILKLILLKSQCNSALINK